MRPLKILYSYTGLTYDEGARYIHHLMQAMRAQGQVVEACCSLESALALALKADGFTVYEMPVAQGVTVVSQLLRWRKWLKQQNYDVVNNNSHTDTFLVGIAARLAGVPLVVRTYHQAKSLPSTFIQRKIPQRIIAINQFIRKQLLQRGIKTSALTVVYDAVEFSEHEASIDLREKLDLDTKTLLIATQVQLHKGSGALELIQATMQQQTERAYRGWLEQLR